MRDLAAPAKNTADLCWVCFSLTFWATLYNSSGLIDRRCSITGQFTCRNPVRFTDSVWEREKTAATYLHNSTGNMSTCSGIISTCLGS